MGVKLFAIFFSCIAMAMGSEPSEPLSTEQIGERITFINKMFESKPKNRNDDLDNGKPVEYFANKLVTKGGEMSPIEIEELSYVRWSRFARIVDTALRTLLRSLEDKYSACMDKKHKIEESIRQVLENIDALEKEFSKMQKEILCLETTITTLRNQLPSWRLSSTHVANATEMQTIYDLLDRILPPHFISSNEVVDAILGFVKKNGVSSSDAESVIGKFLADHKPSLVERGTKLIAEGTFMKELLQPLGIDAEASDKELATILDLIHVISPGRHSLFL